MSAIAGKQTTSRRGGRLWRLVWRVALVLLLVPLVLVPVYKFARPVSTLMIYEWVTNGAIERAWVPFEEISPVLVSSVLMSEDGKFCAHHGLDWDEISKVLDRSDDRPRGASTIAMQTVKNLFLWPSRSYLRKAIEMPLALYADSLFGKKRLMEIYLNVVEWGPGVFGAEAAARHYFKRSAKNLTAAQSALLAATLPNPTARDPAHPTRNLALLARTIAGRARASAAYVDCLYP
ncbi:MAG: monofunctional biosynthetic peptidoglycan transglycosylase [Bauldia sp.]|nr:monofunctional biosynthetic peptidoglycan transglycosylase [Bauldia sp.]